RHPGDAPCAARDRGISPVPDAPSARAEPRDARQPTSDYIAAPSPSPLVLCHCERSEAISRQVRSIDRDCFVPPERPQGGRPGVLAMTSRIMLHQCARRWAVLQALAAAGAFVFLHLIEMSRFEQGRADCRFRADLAPET